MKKLSPLLAMLLLLLTPAPAAVVSLTNFSTTTPTAGSTFTADVTVTGVFDAPAIGDELIGFGFNMFTDNGAVASVVSAVLGSLFTPAGAAGADVSAFTLAPSLVAGDFAEPLLLATLTFQAVGAGTTNVGVLTDVPGNPDHGLVYLGNTLGINASQSITVLDGSAVPEPSTLFLLGGALLCAGLRRRR